MALSSAERAQVRSVLGYADTAAFPASWVESTMGAISADAENQIRGWLGELTIIDTQLATARANRIQVSSLEGINLAGEKELNLLLREGSRLATRISIALGVEKLYDPYAMGGTGGPGGALNLG